MLNCQLCIFQFVVVYHLPLHTMFVVSTPVLKVDLFFMFRGWSLGKSRFITIILQTNGTTGRTTSSNQVTWEAHGSQKSYAFRSGFGRLDCSSQFRSLFGPRERGGTHVCGRMRACYAEGLPGRGAVTHQRITTGEGLWTPHGFSNHTGPPKKLELLNI